MDNRLPAPIAALCRLQPGSLAEFAESLGLQKSNLLAALAGRRPLPARAMAALHDRLGLDEAARLANDRVHRWKVRSAADLAAVADAWIDEAKLTGVRGSGQPESLPTRLWLLEARRRDAPGRVVALLGGGAWVTQLGPTVEVDAKPRQVDDLSVFDHEDIPPDSLAAVASRHALAGAKTPATWSDFVAAARKLGVRPEEAWQALTDRLKS